MNFRIANIILSCVFGSISFGQTYEEVFKTVAFDRAAEDRLGYSVDISENYAIVGAYGDDFGGSNPNMGSAYIFEKTGYDNWEFVQKISNSDQDDYDRFGWSVALFGEYAVIGAYAEDHDIDDDNYLASAGSVYIFKRNEVGSWEEEAKIVASDRQEDDEFGWSVDIYDSTIVVGAHHEGHNVSGGAYEYHAGSVYIFDKNSDGDWIETQKIVASHRSDDHHYPNGRPDEEDLSDLFGGSVAIWGDYLIAGSHMHDYGLGGVGTGFRWNQGAAYIFERSDGTWSEVQKIQANIQTAWDRFGWAVDLDSNIAVIGVPTEDESEFEGASLMNAGGAYIFERDADGDWIQQQKLDASDRTTGDHFGQSVSIENNYLVIGAEQEDLAAELADPELFNAGGAYIFEKDEDGDWIEIQKIDAGDRQAEDYFGWSVGVSGHSVIVGAWQQDLNENGEDAIEDAGAAYIYSSLVCEPYTQENDITICYDEFYNVAGNSYNETGTYTDSLKTVNACDSIIITNLTVTEPIYFSQTPSICAGDTFETGLSVYDENGTYYDTLTALTTGCDSIIITELTIIEPIYFNQYPTICSGVSFEVGDESYNETGVYIDSLVAATGCDSIVITELTVTPPIVYSQDIYRCYGESFSVDDSIYTVSGTYTNYLSTPEGCDSTVITNLTIEAQNLRTQNFILCYGEGVEVGENFYTNTGIFYDTLVSYTACDSIIITDLYILPAINTDINQDFDHLTAGDPAILSTTFQWIDCNTDEWLIEQTERSMKAPYNGNFAVIITDGACQDTSECVIVEGLSTEKNELNTFKIYPNPTNGAFLIELPSSLKPTQFQYEIVNELGQTVYQNKSTQAVISIDLNLQPGVYLVKMYFNDIIQVKRVVIR
ncbi:T9SS type A sorting domain-containing protein [Crocinitomix algicola]|uniref:T9SS type A sorting domain-containing protein n=1 Tax=Crocinitomix algicola TaxID=1740263 RepID=UPI000872A660|nr:T9SS type A sorting domain-containing protein [Crocinitomix algicola]